jgi:hypothetical protein
MQFDRYLPTFWGKQGRQHVNSSEAMMKTEAVDESPVLL